MKTIAILGGTGMTGMCVVDHALSKGLAVRVLYRNEATVPDRFKGKVELVKGDATEVEDIKTLLKNCDAVCIVLGTRNKLGVTADLSLGTQNVINVMKEQGMSTVSACMSSFLFRNPAEVPPQFENINNEHKKMLESLRTSGLNFICVLPPHISDQPSSKVIVTCDKSPGSKVSKYDLAKFLVDSLSQPEYYGKICGIATM